VRADLVVGKPFPDIRLPETTGRELALSEIAAGRPLVLAFVRGWWCPKEQVRVRGLVALQEEIQRHAASVQSFEAHAARKERDLEERSAALLAANQPDNQCDPEPIGQASPEGFFVQAETALRKQQAELERLLREFRQLLSAVRTRELPERKRGSGHRERLPR